MFLMLSKYVEIPWKFVTSLQQVISSFIVQIRDSNKKSVYINPWGHLDSRTLQVPWPHDLQKKLLIFIYDL